MTTEEHLEEIKWLLERLITLVAPIALASADQYEGKNNGEMTEFTCQQAYNLIQSLQMEGEG
jgi:hypothetical protein